jgi:hypothetical protein
MLRFHAAVEPTAGSYEAVAFAGPMVISAGRDPFTPAWDTLVIREGFADTLTMALVPHVYCVDELSQGIGPTRTQVR